MLILGIDPGTATVGFGFLQLSQGQPPSSPQFGTIQTDRHLSAPERLAITYADMVSLLSARRPDVLAVEELFFLKNVNTAMPVAQARGVILLAAAHAGLPVVGYSPAQVKMTVTGSGKALKPDVQEAVRDLLGLATIPRPDDAADALAIALTHARVLEGRGELVLTPAPVARVSA
ncbi:MAG: crossover junction endodeoxyribonuclease RuvC [Candidatus Sericytochromatia bacterium]|nr:crossover junction endodeoxyribonuclease RuvC [Candidatus Sericytochromatia bacterium]